MAELLNRVSRITIDDILIHSELELREGKGVKQGLDVRFSVERTRKREPNKATVEIFNLNPDHRGEVAALPKDAQLIIEAGYSESIGEIFRGTVDDGRSKRERVDWLTMIEGSDGGRELRSKRVNESFPAGTSVATVLEVLARKTGLGIGNADRLKLARAALTLEGGIVSREFVEGTAVSGSASEEFTRLLWSAGLEWSVQGGNIQILDLGGKLDKPPVLLAAPVGSAPGTGLIGSPDVGKDGILKARSLMNADIVPGIQVRVDSKHVQDSLFTVLKATYTGDTSGQDWYVDIEAKAS